MSKKRKITYWISGIVLVLCVGLPLLTRLAPMDPSESEIQALFDSTGVTYTHGSFPYKERSMHYVSVGDDTKPMVLFIHGSPGHWSNFMAFMANPELASRAHLVAVDRPGYGNSTGGVEMVLEQQAASIAPVLELNKSGKPVILVGHSFGGGVIARLAMDNPNQIGALVFAAPTLAPELEEIMLIQHIGNFPLFRWLMADWLDVCNQEMQPLADELIKAQPLWKNVTAPTTMIHGDADWIVPVGNIEYLESMMPNNPPEVIRYEEMNHFIPWEQPELIYQSVYKYLDMLEQQ